MPPSIVSSEFGVAEANTPDVIVDFFEAEPFARQRMRRFTRLTNAFSKKIENLGHAVALHFMHYNFARIHQTLRVTPAMEAGVADHVWSIEEIVGLLDRRTDEAA